jgi:hypothetical protein
MMPCLDVAYNVGHAVGYVIGSALVLAIPVILGLGAWWAITRLWRSIHGAPSVSPAIAGTGPTASRTLRIKLPAQTISLTGDGAHGTSAEELVRELQKVLGNGVITQDQFDAKRVRILDDR